MSGVESLKIKNAFRACVLLLLACLVAPAEADVVAQELEHQASSPASMMVK